MSDSAVCELCGEPMPAGETMFKFHGYSGPCPKPPLTKPDDATDRHAGRRLADGRMIWGIVIGLGGVLLGAVVVGFLILAAAGKGMCR